MHDNGNMRKSNNIHSLKGMAQTNMIWRLLRVHVNAIVCLCVCVCLWALFHQLVSIQMDMVNAWLVGIQLRKSCRLYCSATTLRFCCNFDSIKNVQTIIINFY